MAVDRSDDVVRADVRPNGWRSGECGSDLRAFRLGIATLGPVARRYRIYIEAEPASRHATKPRQRRVEVHPVVLVRSRKVNVSRRKIAASWNDLVERAYLLIHAPDGDVEEPDLPFWRMGAD